MSTIGFLDIKKVGLNPEGIAGIINAMSRVHGFGPQIDSHKNYLARFLSSIGTLLMDRSEELKQRISAVLDDELKQKMNNTEIDIITEFFRYIEEAICPKKGREMLSLSKLNCLDVQSMRDIERLKKYCGKLYPQLRSAFSCTSIVDSDLCQGKEFEVFKSGTLFRTFPSNGEDENDFLGYKTLVDPGQEKKIAKRFLCLFKPGELHRQAAASQSRRKCP